MAAGPAAVGLGSGVGPDDFSSEILARATVLPGSNAKALSRQSTACSRLSTTSDIAIHACAFIGYASMTFRKIIRALAMSLWLAAILARWISC